MGLAERLGIPPVAGGVLDQPVWILRALAIIEAGTGDAPPLAPEVHLADLQELLV